MKTKFSFSKNHTSLFLAIVTLLLLSAQSTTFAASGTWISSGSTSWTTDANWSGSSYPGTPPGTTDTATFNNLSTTTSLFVSPVLPLDIAAIDFTALEKHAFTITVNGELDISGAGITNSSLITQNFVTAEGGGVISFQNSATAGIMTAFTNNGGAVFLNGGRTEFNGTSNAGSATITDNGGTVSGAFGGRTQFSDTSDAGSATLIAKGGTASGAGGGSIQFFASSTGGTASVDVRNDGTGAAGNLDISARIGGVTIGSLEGSGDVFLGARNLTVGNNLSKTFSGVMQDGGIGLGTGGSLTKIGTGALTLSGANTYTGGTTVNDGHLFVNNTTGSGTGTGNVTVNNNGTVTGGTVLGGNGTISGAVTVNHQANLAPGPTGNGSTGILHTGDLTLNSNSNFSLDLNGNVAGTSYDQVDVTGMVMISKESNLLINSALGLAVGEHLFIVENDGTDAVTGTFAGLPEGATFTQDGVTFTIDYFASGQGGGNDIELTVDAVVPEPATWVGGALAFVAIAYWKRRRFAQMFASRVKANSVAAV